MYSLYLDSKDNCIYKKWDSNEIKLEYNSPSEIKDSPNGKYAAFISPNEWELPGDIYIMEKKLGEIKKMGLKTFDNRPKDLIWINDEIVAFIYGPVYGTVSVGGDIYLIDINTLKKVQLTNYGTAFQIQSFNRVVNNEIHFIGIRYIDKIYNNFVTFEGKVDF